MINQVFGTDITLNDAYVGDVTSHSYLLVASLRNAIRSGEEGDREE